MPGSDVVASRLRAVVGPQVVTDPDMTASYTADWTGRFEGRTVAVVRPGSTDEVAGVVGVCRELGVALVPQGGNTGLVGGGVPLEGEVVLSLRRLQSLEPVDTLAGQVTAGAGVALSALHEAAALHGWAYGVDLASRDSATVGGTVATNAGGIHVLRHGDTRAQVIGVEAVLGTGATISHLGGLIKDNTGYHLPGLLCGSEGTLAVITAARLRLVPAMPCRTVAVLAFSTVARALDASALLRRALPTLEACELFLAPGLELVCSTLQLAMPFPIRHPVYLLVEVADRSDPTDTIGEAVGSLTDVLGVVVATDASDDGPSCGATARTTPKPSTPWGRRTSSTSPFPSAPWPSSSTGSPKRCGPSIRPPEPGCSATSATATSMSTSAGWRWTTNASMSACSAWSVTSEGASVPSMGSAWPKNGGWACPAAAPNSPPSDPSSGPSTRTGC